MMNLLIENIKVFGQEMLKMHSFLLKNLINIEFFYNPSISIVEDLQKIHIMYLESMWEESGVRLKFVYLK